MVPPFFPFRNSIRRNAIPITWASPRRFVIIWMRSPRYNSFYLCMMHQYNILCNRISCWQLPARPRGDGAPAARALTDHQRVAEAGDESIFHGFAPIRLKIRAQFDFTLVRKREAPLLTNSSENCPLPRPPRSTDPAVLIKNISRSTLCALRRNSLCWHELACRIATSLQPEAQ